MFTFGAKEGWLLGGGTCCFMLRFLEGLLMCPSRKYKWGLQSPLYHAATTSLKS